jgi:hypothetical protein
MCARCVRLIKNFHLKISLARRHTCGINKVNAERSDTPFTNQKMCSYAVYLFLGDGTEIIWRLRLFTRMKFWNIKIPDGVPRELSTWILKWNHLAPASARAPRGKNESTWKKNKVSIRLYKSSCWEHFLVAARETKRRKVFVTLLAASA